MDFNNDDNLDYKLNEIASKVIKEKRIKRGYSLEDVCNKLNNIITRQSLYRYECNEARMKNEIFAKICLALDEEPQNVWNEINSRFMKSLSFDNGQIVDINQNTIKIPVLGVIKAGTPIEAQENILEYIDIPKEWTKGEKKFYGLKISGDSMFPKYQPNDIVIFEQNEDISIANGKDCAVMVNGDDATFKKFTLNDNGVILTPLNLENSDGFQTTFYNVEQVLNLPVRIVGIAVEKRTRL